ncbi:hypothetical protein Nepgr_024152 [Nepenthes gracilis]|uniref:Staygreen protein domain-containing protein n=1 Tax=Nepenthes gracilis TaxID=150966 RepID=A0AAD3T4G6_NEPGR|nr:hypothetical protein Nepgr_024152 [Nepenthes gracilis]
MASHCAYAFSPLPSCYNSVNCKLYSAKRSFPLFVSSITHGRAPYQTNTLIFEAARLLGPPARFETSKLKVAFEGEEIENYSRIVPRIYTLSHCDFTANLTLTVSNNISIDKLQGWYSKDDVVAEWKEVKGSICLQVHCYVSGPSLFLDLAAEFRYHIFSKELPLVLQAVLNGDSALFREHQELVDAIVWVYFHSTAPKYNRVECWGPLKDAALVDLDRQERDQIHTMLTANKSRSCHHKSFLQALFTFLLCVAFHSKSTPKD